MQICSLRHGSKDYEGKHISNEALEITTVFSGFLVNWEEIVTCLGSRHSLGAEINYKPQYPLKSKAVFGGRYFVVFDGKVLWQAVLGVRGSYGHAQRSGGACEPQEGGCVPLEAQPWKVKWKQHKATSFYPGRCRISCLPTKSAQFGIMGSACSR